MPTATKSVTQPVTPVPEDRVRMTRLLEEQKARFLEMSLIASRALGVKVREQPPTIAELAKVFAGKSRSVWPGTYMFEMFITESGEVGVWDNDTQTCYTL